MKRNPIGNGRSSSPVPRLAIATGALLLPLVTLAACDPQELLEVEDPEFASPESLADPSALPTLIAGAIGDFQIAYSGSGYADGFTNPDAFITVTALLSDEFYASGSFETRIRTDQRDQFDPAQGNTSDDTFNTLQAARRSLNAAAEAVARVAEDADNSRIAELRALEGFTLVALGEGFCGNIPISATTESGGPGEPGQPLSTAEIFQEAIARFDQALAIGPDYSLAKVGKGRALLDLGEFEAAAAATAGVPTEYVYLIDHSANSARQNNGVFTLQDNGRYSVANSEGRNGLPYRSAMDPRVPWVEDPDGGFVSTIPLYLDLRYPSFDADVPLAGGIEARLIEAEAALNAGNVDSWLSILNDLRADVQGLMSARFESYSANLPEDFPSTLTPLAPPAIQTERVQLHFSERAFWLYTTGHRLGDLRRMIRQYGFSAAQVFPIGDYRQGGTFGSDVSLPIPFEEINNPEYAPTMCVTTEA